MKKESINSFSGGLISDLNPLTTPQTVLTDAVNATLLTFDGNELILQNDMGNTTLVDPSDDTKFVKLTKGFIPLGVKEYGGIIYIVSYNPETLETEIGSFPGPQFEQLDSINESNLDIKTIVSFSDTESVISNLGKVYQITDANLKPGDYFVVTLPGLEVSQSHISDLTTRKIYKIKLINIDSNNRDITDKFLKAQQYLASPNSASANLHNQWFLPIPLATGTTLEDYIAKGLSKVYPFNLKSGRLGVKFELEDIDLFRISKNSNDSYFPILETVNGGSTPVYTLTFNEFDVQEPSYFKVEKIVLSYKLYDNSTGEDITPAISTITKVITDDFIKESPVGNITLIKSKVPDDPNGVFQLTLNSKNVTIEYTITPWSSSLYDRPFTNQVIHNRLDLSKDPLFWESAAMYQFKEEYTYNQAIDSSVSGNITLDLDVADKDIDRYYSSSAWENGVNHTIENKSKILKNLRWILDNSIVSLNINIKNEFDAFAALLGGVNGYVTSKIQIDYRDLVDFYVDYFDEVNPLKTPKEIEVLNANYEFDSNFEDIQLIQSNRYEINGYSNGTNSYYDGYLTMTTFSLTIPSITDFTIKPVIGKYKSSQGNTIPVSTFGGVTSTEAVINYGDEYFPTDSELAWSTEVASGDPITFATQLKTSFNKASNGYNRVTFNQSNSTLGSLNNGISKIISDLIVGQYYVLNFYARSAWLNTIRVGIANIGLTEITLTTDWKLYSIPFKKSSETQDKLVFYSNAVDVPLFGNLSNVSLANVSIKQKLIQSLDQELYQDVYTYEEHVDIIKSESGEVLFTNRGTFLPYPHCNILGRYSLSSNGDFSGTNSVTFTPEDASSQTFIIRE